MVTRAWIGVLAAIGISASANADHFLRAIDYDTGNLFAIDPTNVNAGFVDMDIVGSTGIAGMADLVWNQADGRLYGYTVGPQAKLYRINPNTAQTTVVGSLNVGFVFEGAMAFGPNGDLYGANQGEAESPNFFKINLTSGAATIVNTIGGLAHDVNGMVYRSDGKFAAFDRETNNLLIFNPANGFISDQFATGRIAGEVGGMASHFSRTYLSTSGPESAFPSDNSLYSVNPMTGSTTLIGAFDGFEITGTGISGIAAIPEPASLIALAAGLAPLIRRQFGRKSR